jgi:hypothetical protein
MELAEALLVACTILWPLVSEAFSIIRKLASILTFLAGQQKNRMNGQLEEYSVNERLRSLYCMGQSFKPSARQESWEDTEEMLQEEKVKLTQIMTSAAHVRRIAYVSRSAESMLESWS